MGEVKIGDRYGKWVVVDKAVNQSDPQHKYFRCKCDCGNEKVVRDRSLLRGTSRSCGCLRRENPVIYEHKFKNLVGSRFGKLVVLKLLYTKYEPKHKFVVKYYLCKCDCGNEKVIAGRTLQAGDSKSCGCLHAERLKEVFTTHGKTHSRLYSVWHSMLGRCGIHKGASEDLYRNYVGRGITLEQPEWRKFENFQSWALANGYDDTLQLDREDNERGYSATNCRWVTARQNTRNRRNSMRLPSGEHVFDFCERWLGHELQIRSTEYNSIVNTWLSKKKLPDFVFENIRKRAIADLDAAHKQMEVEI